MADSTRDELPERRSPLSRRRFARLSVGAGMGLAFGSAVALETPRPTSGSVDAWVAREGQQPTGAVNPWYIDEHAAADLAFYHPIAADPSKFQLKHVAAVDAQGRAYARVAYLSENWHANWSEMMFALKLYPEQVNGVEVLRDRAIEDEDTPLMHGWKVVEWLAVHNVDSNVQCVHHDYITWRKGGVLAKSMMGWRAY